jgi:hypothetical protein
MALSSLLYRAGLTILSVLLLATAAIAQSTDDCADVLKYTGNRYFNGFNEQQISDLNYYLQCTAEGKSVSGSLGAGYEGFDLNIGGASARTSSACQQTNSNFQIGTVQSVAQAEPIQAAIESWLACKRASKQNLEISVLNTGVTFGINVKNNKPGNGFGTYYMQTFIGEEKSNSCDVFPPSDMNKESGEITLKKVKALPCDV